MKIYHVPGTRSIRVIWLCNELETPLQVETIPRFDAAFKASPEWRAKSPTGKVPVLEDGPISMYESGAMVQFILEKYGAGRLVPSPGTPESAEYLKWSWFAEATFARPLGDISQHTSIKPEAERIPAVVDDAKVRARLCLDGIDSHMANREYLIDGGFTAADIMMGYSLFLARRNGVLSNDHTHATRYFVGLLTRQAFKDALSV